VNGTPAMGADQPTRTNLPATTENVHQLLAANTAAWAGCDCAQPGVHASRSQAVKAQAQRHRFPLTAVTECRPALQTVDLPQVTT